MQGGHKVFFTRAKGPTFDCRQEVQTVNKDVGKAPIQRERFYGAEMRRNRHWR
jgi:hypothetical protein